MEVDDIIEEPSWNERRIIERRTIDKQFPS
jgi:hypothetical protein